MNLTDLQVFLIIKFYSYMNNISLKDILSGKSFSIENENYEFEVIYENWNDFNFFTSFSAIVR